MRKLLFILFCFFSIKAFSQTKITAPLVRNNSADTTYGSNYDSLGYGGYVTFTAIANRNAFPMPQRRYLMEASVKETDSVYILSGGLTNEYWLPIYKASEGGQTWNGVMQNGANLYNDYHSYLNNKSWWLDSIGDFTVSSYDLDGNTTTNFEVTTDNVALERDAISGSSAYSRVDIGGLSAYNYDLSVNQFFTWDTSGLYINAINDEITQKRGASNIYINAPYGYNSNYKLLGVDTTNNGKLTRMGISDINYWSLLPSGHGVDRGDTVSVGSSTPDAAFYSNVQSHFDFAASKDYNLKVNKVANYSTLSSYSTALSMRTNELNFNQAVLQPIITAKQNFILKKAPTAPDTLGALTNLAGINSIFGFAVNSSVTNSDTIRVAGVSTSNLPSNIYSPNGKFEIGIATDSSDNVLPSTTEYWDIQPALSNSISIVDYRREGRYKFIADMTAGLYNNIDPTDVSNLFRTTNRVGLYVLADPHADTQYVVYSDNKSVLTHIALPAGSSTDSIVTQTNGLFKTIANSALVPQFTPYAVLYQGMGSYRGDTSKMTFDSVNTYFSVGTSIGRAPITAQGSIGNNTSPTTIINIIKKPNSGSLADLSGPRITGSIVGANGSIYGLVNIDQIRYGNDSSGMLQIRTFKNGSAKGIATMRPDGRWFLRSESSSAGMTDTTSTLSLKDTASQLSFWADNIHGYDERFTVGDVLYMGYKHVAARITATGTDDGVSLFQFKSSTSSGAAIRINPGASPTSGSKKNGQIWIDTTAAGYQKLWVRENGVDVRLDSFNCTPTLNDVANNGNTTTNAITIGGLTVTNVSGYNSIYTDYANNKYGFGDISNKSGVGKTWIYDKADSLYPLNFYTTSHLAANFDSTGKFYVYNNATMFGALTVKSISNRVSSSDSVLTVNNGLIGRRASGSGYFTPTLTNTLNISGSALATATYTRNDSVVHANIGGSINASGAGATTLTVTLPIATSSVGAQFYIGSGAVGLNGGGSFTAAFVTIISTTQATIQYVATAATTDNFNVIFDYKL